jgi:hypothetical protein
MLVIVLDLEVDLASTGAFNWSLVMLSWRSAFTITSVMLIRDMRATAGMIQLKPGIASTCDPKSVPGNRERLGGSRVRCRRPG